MQFVDRFLTFIGDNYLFNEGDSVLLAVSGGKDSVLMAHLFAEVHLKFAIAHCNFKLRGESSDRDERFVKWLANQLEVPFYSVQFDTEAYATNHQVSIQMAARDLRYEWLELTRQKEGYDFLAVAHHRTDSVETVLLNMLRGTGVAGLVGIFPKRGFVVRPLLAFTSQEVQEEVGRRNLEFREDISNASTKYKRNKIRLDVLPHLRALNEDLEDTFERNGNRFLQISQWLKKIADDFRASHFKKYEDDTFQIDLTVLKTLDPLSLWIYELFHPYGFSESVLSDLISSWDHGTGRRFLSPFYELLVNRDHLLLSPLSQHTQKAIIIDTFPHQFNWHGEGYLIRSMEGVDVDFGRFPMTVDFDCVEMPLRVRSWQEGDKFRLLGMRGKKKVSDLLVEQKVPLTKKDKVPLLVDAKDTIIAVWPWRINERVKITTKTKKVIIFEKTKHG